MSEKKKVLVNQEDPTAEERKGDHITLAFESQTSNEEIDQRFYYEPMLCGHPKEDNDIGLDFLGKRLDVPIWVSSMTGGTKYANIINKNLARAAGEYKMGMGLGSCRSLLFSDDHFEDFNIRKYLEEQPLFANLGIAQVEILVQENKVHLITTLLKKLDADGLIVHVNPLQEWLQPEGDRYFQSPIETIKQLRDQLNTKIIVKEVGQGFGPASIKALLSLDIDCIDFAASGGTNFSKIELFRADKETQSNFNPLVFVGHTASEMVDLYNHVSSPTIEKEVIISGGVKTFLDGYYLTQKCSSKAIYGQASAFLKHAQGDYEELQSYVESQINGLRIASQFLRIKE